MAVTPPTTPVAGGVIISRRIIIWTPGIIGGPVIIIGSRSVIVRAG
jgi:hypothetical protein